MHIECIHTRESCCVNIQLHDVNYSTVLTFKSFFCRTCSAQS